MILISMTIYSCSLFKKTTRQVNKTDSTVNINTVKVDKSITTITEKVDTTVKTKSDTAKSSIALNTLINPFNNQPKQIDTTIKSGNIDLNIKYNKKTKSYDFTTVDLPKDVSVYIDKTTTTQNNITTKTNQKTEVKKKTVLKTSNPIFSPTSLAIGVGIFLIIVGLIWFLWKKFGSKII